MNWFMDVVKNKYATFGGRARRQEYWMYTLFYVIFAIVIGVIDAVLGLGLLGFIYTLALLVPSIAVTVRRLHDTGRSGWWVLIAFLPLIGIIVLIVFMVLDSQPGDNAYGPNPKAGAAPAAA